MSDLTDRQREVLDLLPADEATLAADLGVSTSTVKDHISNARKRGANIELVDGEYRRGEGTPDSGVTLPDPDPDAEADESDLTDRERYLAGELQTGATVDELAEDIGTRASVVTQHLRDMARNGWQLYQDDSTGEVVLEGDHALRSSEHTGTRTRKANRWWEMRHTALVREFKQLSRPTTETTVTPGGEDWVLHLTDIHAGDRVRRDDGRIVYQTEDIPALIDHVTERSLSLADTHGAAYDTAHILWGGDMVTNEGIYEGQFEDLDAWLDEQHEILHAPLLRQLKAYSERFETVQVVCQVGNHGEHRASGKSKQANADLILYKSIRNIVAELREHADLLANVEFVIGDAKAYRNFELRGGAVKGHLRHGQHRKPQATTSARRKEWLATLRDHDFDVAYMGHHHVSGRIPWDGPPVLATASPKPAGEFVESIGERVATDGFDSVATAHGVSDDGLTAVFPIDLRGFEDDDAPLEEWQWGKP